MVVVVLWGCYGHALVPEGAQLMLHALVARLCGGCLHCGLAQPLHGHCRVVDALVARLCGGCLHCGLVQPLHGHWRVVDALVALRYGGCLHCGLVQPLHGHWRVVDALVALCYGGCLHCGLKQPLHGHRRVVDALVGSRYGDGYVADALDEQGLGGGCVEPLHGGDRWCDDALGWVQYGGETPLLLACLWFVLGGGDELGLVLMYFFS